MGANVIAEDAFNRDKHQLNNDNRISESVNQPKKTKSKRTLYSSGTGSRRVLNQVVQPIVSMEICNDSQHYHGRLHESHICAGYEQGGRGPCGVSSQQ